MTDRRRFLALAALGSAGLLLPGRLLAAGALVKTPITVYKSSTCGCCTSWVTYLTANGFAPRVVTVDDPTRMDEIKTSSGVPEALRSCHTALVGEYAVEGHVPADLIAKMLREKPQARGLTVPGMISGTPGMDNPGAAPQHYDVLLFQRNGTTRVYASR
ncbi:MAG TPA: DUF411 domain-containing protein [Gemmatimonadales bacterium]|nr:DUF411 domain-containing protein [Gemmatimonadales bacterium]